MWWDEILTLSKLWKVHNHVAISRTTLKNTETWLKGQKNKWNSIVKKNKKAKNQKRKIKQVEYK